MFSPFQGKYAEAEPLYERSQAIREKKLGPEHPSMAGLLNNRAALLKAQVRMKLLRVLLLRSSANTSLLHALSHNHQALAM